MIGQLKIDRHFCSVCELRSIFIAVHKYVNHDSHCDMFSTLSQATAEPLARRINEISTTFTIGRQEDPSELFICLLNHMTECLSSSNSISNINSFSTIIQDIFGVHFRSVVICSKCQNKTSTENWESMWAVSIDAQTTLLQSLVEFCKPELLCNGDSAYHCSTCAQRVQATKSLHLVKALPIITIHLKRFNYNQQTNTINKIKTFISYPELLNLAPYFDPNIKESIESNKENIVLIYQLYAVIAHLGEQPTSGHIYAYILSPDGLWYKANDVSITQVNINQVLTNENAYMLFYSKKSEDKFVFNETAIEINRTPSASRTSSSVARLSTLKTLNNNKTTVYRRLVSLYEYDILSILYLLFYNMFRQLVLQKKLFLIMIQIYNYQSNQA